MISLDCPCCGVPFLTATQRPGQTEEEFRAAWRALTTSVPVCNCTGCEMSFKVTDGGNPMVAVSLTNVSKPRINSVNVATMPRTGGTNIVIHGQALNVGNLVVRFNGVAAPQVDQRTATSARVVTPPGSYLLNVAERIVRLVLTPLLGSFSVGESFTTNGGGTGVVRRINGNQHAVFFANIASGLSSLVGTSIVGNSGAVATVASADIPRLQVGEVVSGSISAAMAVVRTVSPLRVDSPTCGFVVDELVTGTTSGAVVRLAATAPYSGAVAITVENEYGKRLVGSSLINVLSYI
jgi:hypothetical protein